MIIRWAPTKIKTDHIYINWKQLFFCLQFGRCKKMSAQVNIAKLGAQDTNLNKRVLLGNFYAQAIFRLDKTPIEVAVYLFLYLRILLETICNYHKKS